MVNNGITTKNINFEASFDLKYNNYNSNNNNIISSQQTTTTNFEDYNNTSSRQSKLPSTTYYPGSMLPGKLVKKNKFS